MKVSGEGFISSKATLGCYDGDRLWSARLLVDELANEYFGGWTGLPTHERP